MVKFILGVSCKFEDSLLATGTSLVTGYSLCPAHTSQGWECTSPGQWHTGSCLGRVAAPLVQPPGPKERSFRAPTSGCVGNVHACGERCA